MNDDKVPTHLAQSHQKAQDEQLIIPTAQRQYDKFFAELTRLKDDEVIIKPNCKLCKHPLRAEAEEKWEQCNKSFAPVVRLLEEGRKNNPDNPHYPQMTHSNVRLHMLHHYDQQEKRKFMREYTERISAIMNYKRAMDEKFEFMANALEAQFIEIASDPTLDVLKKSDVMVKISKSIAEIHRTQAELRGDMDPYYRLLDRFKKVWIMVVNNQKDDDTKQLLLEALNQFQGEIESHAIEED